MQSAAKTVSEYLNELPSDRKKIVSAVRDVVLASLPDGIEETMQYGMISYVVPLSRYPAGYLGKKDVPLPVAAVASQKNYVSLYLFCLYSDPAVSEQFEQAYRATGKKLNMGKSCIRFTTLEELPLELIAQTVQKMTIDDHIRSYEASRGSSSAQ